MYSLLLVGDPRGLRWALEEGDNRVGRNPKGDGHRIAIGADEVPEATTISRNHVIIGLRGGGAVVTRIADANIVLLNGREIPEGAGPSELRAGDLLTLGSKKPHNRIGGAILVGA